MPPSNLYIVFPATDDDGGLHQLIKRVLQSAATAIDHQDSAMDGNATATTGDTAPPPASLASNALMAVLLAMIIILAIYFCCISNREISDVRARNRNSPNAIDNMTPHERATYVKDHLITKKYEAHKAHVSEVESGAKDDVAIDNGDEYSHDQCPICLLDYKEGDLISWSRNKQCHHCFHRDCLSVWLMKHEECPYCRRPYLVDDADESTRTGTDVEAGAAPSLPRPEPVDASPLAREVSG